MLASAQATGKSIWGLGIGLAIVLAALAVAPLLGGAAVRVWAIALSAGCLVLAFAAPFLPSSFERVLRQVSDLALSALSALVMAVLFFGVVTPIALIQRLFRPDPLNLRPDAKAETYWVTRNTAVRPFPRTF